MSASVYNTYEEATFQAPDDNQQTLVFDAYAGEEAFNVAHWHEETKKSFNRSRKRTRKAAKMLIFAAPFICLGIVLITSTLVIADDDLSTITQRILPQRQTEWPTLKITGTGWTNDGQGGFAMINGKQIMESHSIDDVTLINVDEYELLVEYKGERKNLYCSL